jgi:drug/metabolite transporter (DMT)-like permease
VSLTVARFVTAALFCGAWCLIFRPRESATVLRRHWRRLLLCGFLAVPQYNFALYYAQQHGVEAPVASLTTALLPLFVMVLSVLFLGERFTARRLSGFAVAVAGMVLVSSARGEGLEVAYPALLALTAVAPVSWSIYTVVSKPLAAEVSPVVWSYLATTLGALMVVPLIPTYTWPHVVALDGPGWFALLYLALPCTVLGFALWTWLLRHLPATVVGFTVFLNPPLTTLSKAAFALLLPATFVFAVQPREWVGGAVVLLGMGIALTGVSKA